MQFFFLISIAVSSIGPILERKQNQSQNEKLNSDVRDQMEYLSDEHYLSRHFRRQNRYDYTNQRIQLIFWIKMFSF